jgi:hypothetical protein
MTTPRNTTPRNPKTSKTSKTGTTGKRTGRPEQDGPVHFLDGLRCLWCKALNASWLCADGATVECAECGQTSLVVDGLPTTTREGA